MFDSLLPSSQNSHSVFGRTVQAVGNPPPLATALPRSHEPSAPHACRGGGWGDEPWTSLALSFHFASLGGQADSFC